MESKFKRIEWKIPNCSKESIKNYKVGDKIESGTFKIRSGSVVTEWFLGLYPNGDRQGSKAFIGLFLGLRDSNSKDFVITLKLGIKGKLEIDSHICTDYSRKGEEFENGTRGYSKFLSWGELFNPADRYVINGEITVFCEISLKSTEPPETESSSTLKNILLNYKNSFLEGKFADLKLKMSDGEVLKSHKHVLASQSKVFNAMFTNDCKEAKEKVVEIADFDSKTMKEALRFMYYGEVENLDEIALKLLLIAEKYELDELKKKCIESLIKSLTTENVLQYLVISDEISKAKKLFESCIDLIIRFDSSSYSILLTRKYQIIKKSEKWRNLPKNLMMKTMDEMIFYSADTIYTLQGP